MKGKAVWIMIICMSLGLKAQEQESAELFLEEYTDEFQNLFFEALKQKGIQNYDRAVEKLLECKNLEPNNIVVDYELARAYYLDKKYTLAQEHALSAVENEPQNYWYLEHLISILDKQGNTIETFSDRISLSNTSVKENLAKIYFQKRKFKDALQILDGMAVSEFTEDLKQKIEDSRPKKSIRNTSVGRTRTTDRINVPKTKNPVADYKNQIDTLISNRNYQEMKSVAKEAMDKYPLQPYFQYAYGLALSKTEERKEAIEVLEGALDYIFDDTALKNKLFKALSDTFDSMGNEKKAIEYMNKIENGS